jgi:hypothetical protein
MVSIDGVCGDLSLFFHPNPFTMQTPNGSRADSNENSVNPTNDARHASNASTPLTQSQAEFWYLVESQGCKELAHSLKMVHDLALYHSDIPFDAAEKSALFDLKVLWEGLEKMGATV